MDIDNNYFEPEHSYLKLNLCFYYEEPSINTWGSNNVNYELIYFYHSSILQIIKIDSFGDGTLIKQYKINETKLLELFKEITKIKYKDFKEKFLT